MADSPHAPFLQGIGGVFLFATDPGALAGWYRDVLGVQTQEYGDSFFAELPSADLHPGDRISTLTFAIMKAPGPLGEHRSARINWRVTNLDTVLAHLTDKGVETLRKPEMDDSGRFAWCHDPEGNKLELWEPPIPDGADAVG